MLLFLHGLGNGLQDTEIFFLYPHIGTQKYRKYCQGTVVGKRRLLRVKSSMTRDNDKSLTNTQSVVSSREHQHIPKGPDSLVCHRWGQCRQGLPPRCEWHATAQLGPCGGAQGLYFLSWASSLQEGSFHNLQSPYRAGRQGGRGNSEKFISNWCNIYQKGKDYSWKGYLNQCSLIYHWVTSLNVYLTTPYPAPSYSIGEGT